MDRFDDLYLMIRRNIHVVSYFLPIILSNLKLFFLLSFKKTQVQDCSL